LSIIQYCESINAEERQNIICEKLKQSLLCFKGDVYFFDQIHRVVKVVGNKKDDPLKSMIESFVRSSMLILARNPASNDPLAKEENPEYLERLKEMAAYCKIKKNEKAMQQLNNYSPKNVQAFRLKLTPPAGFELDCDLEGIHFVNGRFDLRTSQFAERQIPNYANPATFVTKFIPNEFGPFDKEKCDQVYDHLLKAFGTREKLDYCLAYAGAALLGRSAVTSCSAMFHVGIGGSGKSTFTDWIKAAVTDVYYANLTKSNFDKVWTAYKTFSTIATNV
jgi:phage/plasmid-associated DNA primase